MIFSTLSSKLAGKHEELGTLVREDGAVFIHVHNRGSAFHYTYGCKDKTKKYLYINKKIDGKCKHLYVHQLVAEVFLRKTDELQVIDHINRNTYDNRVENLRYCSRHDNQLNRSVHDICKLKSGVTPSEDSQAYKKAYAEATKAARNTRRRENYWKDPDRFRKAARDYHAAHKSKD